MPERPGTSLPGLLIRRFRVRVPGGPLAGSRTNPQVERLFSHLIAATNLAIVHRLSDKLPARRRGSFCLRKEMDNVAIVGSLVMLEAARPASGGSDRRRRGFPYARGARALARAPCRPRVPRPPSPALERTGPACRLGCR